ncbi:UDP-3-O-acyl-N-acetylglucosamine deacetylase [Beijerinckiaceae bacterium RH AL1]|nr:UDP-3-O-acyl-N-acetylglucosamine deacetylase [Beijerinckiaceae bacterium RH CH11]VVB49698.1 UDP-3-O-acyl-N-acetylglucosamine deacetylase [Beijerinckiaceae bacterium RH AL8]VVC56995.1 UDP-3-O-acyl-N-acetylglucosamine deacetylase [Beijerinckiaceae bacterium RH AL1]
MTRQTTIAADVRVSGVGLHTGRRARVTLRPAPPDHGRRIGPPGGPLVPIAAERWVASRMSTSIALDDGRTARTIEHLMAALAAYGVDNVAIELDGPEVPIFDGSAVRWCRALREAGVVAQDAARRAIRLRAPVQVARDGGMLRAEPCEGFAIDVTHDVLPAFPVMRWRGTVDAPTFEAGLMCARSFGNLHRRLGLTPPHAARPPGAMPHAADPALVEPPGVWEEIGARAGGPAPLLRGWRPWRASLVAGRRLLPPRRYPDEPGRHVALDMIGDLAVLGAPLVGRVVAHNPSHEKTFALVLAILASPEAWEIA